MATGRTVGLRAALPHRETLLLEPEVLAAIEAVPPGLHRGWVGTPAAAPHRLARRRPEAIGLAEPHELIQAAAKSRVVASENGSVVVAPLPDTVGASPVAGHGAPARG